MTDQIDTLLSEKRRFPTTQQRCPSWDTTTLADPAVVSRLKNQYEAEEA